MIDQRIKSAMLFKAATGASAYDAISFSAHPVAECVAAYASGLAVVRQLCARADGTMQARAQADHAGVLMLNLTGSGHVRGQVGNDRVDRPLRRGDVSFVPPGVAVDISYPAAHSALIVAIPTAMIDRAAEELGVRPRVLLPQPHDRLGPLMMMIDQETRRPGFAAEMLIEGLVRAATTILLGHEAPAPAPRHHLAPVKLTRVIEFIEQNLDDNIGLSALAEVAGLSPFHFARTFKLATGQSPYHYVGSRRIARAQRLLVESGKSLAEIALDCGFSSQSHFTSVFSKEVGTPPGKFRRARCA